MKRISGIDLIVDGKRFQCKEFTNVVELPEPEMVEVTIKCTITKEDYNKLMEEVK